MARLEDLLHGIGRYLSLCTSALRLVDPKEDLLRRNLGRGKSGPTSADVNGLRGNDNPLKIGRRMQRAMSLSKFDLYSVYQSTWIFIVGRPIC